MSAPDVPPRDVGALNDESAIDVNRALWVALVAALTGFTRTARKVLGMKHGERCPKCGHSH